MFFNDRAYTLTGNLRLIFEREGKTYEIWPDPRVTMADIRTGDLFKVFISCSRRDSAEFTDELVAGLELAGFAPFLDRHDIAPSEDWEARLRGLIAQADTAVFNRSFCGATILTLQRSGWPSEKRQRPKSRTRNQL